MRRRFFSQPIKCSGNDTNNYLTVEALQDGLQAKLSANACEYRVDDGEWKTLSKATYTESINTGQTLSFRGNLIPNSSYGIGTFTISKKCNLKGNCMSLLFKDDAKNNNSLLGKSFAFYTLFKNNTNIINVDPNFLPATILAEGCYNGIFDGCTNLESFTNLPATTLAKNCYAYMFKATKIQTCPELPATRLTWGVYQYMFSNCQNLTDVPELPATVLGTYCYNGMFYQCKNLKNTSELNATTLADYCYRRMFYQCSSLETSPILHVEQLINACYQEMFYGCTKLNQITMLATDISATNCLNNWVYNVSSTGTFIKHPDMTSLSSDANGIPKGWTVEDNQDSENDSSKNLITFTIDDVEYQAEDGMTWGEWVESEYNILNYLIFDDYICNSTLLKCITVDSVYCTSNEVIISNKNYIISIFNL